LSDAWELMPPHVAEVMPKLYEKEKLGNKAVVYVKFFLPGTGWSWFASEYDPEERIWATSPRKSWRASGQAASSGLKRDLHWLPLTIRAVKERLATGHV
jgi:hypothetical protein